MSLAKWAHAQGGDPKAIAAKAALAKLPQSPKHEDRVLLPKSLPVADRDEYKKGRSDDEIHAAIDKAPVKKIPIKGLTAIQHSVEPARVAVYIDYPDAVPKHGKGERGDQNDKPVVVKANGKSYLYDGHHRTTAAMLRGERQIEARVATLPDVKKTPAHAKR